MNLDFDKVTDLLNNCRENAIERLHKTKSGEVYIVKTNGGAKSKYYSTWCLYLHARDLRCARVQSQDDLKPATVEEIAHVCFLYICRWKTDIKETGWCMTTHFMLCLAWPNVMLTVTVTTSVSYTGVWLHLSYTYFAEDWIADAIDSDKMVPVRCNGRIRRWERFTTSTSYFWRTDRQHLRSSSHSSVTLNIFWFTTRRWLGRRWHTTR